MAIAPASSAPAPAAESATAADSAARGARVIAGLKQLLPGSAVLTSEEARRPYECDGLTAYRRLPLVVALPETPEQVAAVLRLCASINCNPVQSRSRLASMSACD